MPSALLTVVLLLVAEPSLFDLARPATRQGLPAGWQLRAVGGHRAPTFRIVDDSTDGLRLTVHGRDQAAWAWRHLPAAVTDAAVSLAWSWRVLTAPPGADLRFKKSDDAPLRVFVVFGTVEDMARGKARAIFYCWGSEEPEGYTGRSPVSAQILIRRLAGGAEVGPAWQAAAVRPFEDYRRFWGGAAPPIRAVGLMQDTDQTDTSAEAELRELRWVSSDPTTSEGS
ncbi:MAG: DUF3047 domain-containing protein [Gemmatimonadota bacterium]|nr:DUF3047 domain-containing protein [Gemmatimonadota bacterium]